MQNQIQGRRPRDTEQVEEADVAIDAQGRTVIASGILARRATVEEVRVDSTQQDFDFNVELNGSDVFEAEQSPSSAEETFTPDSENQRVGGVDEAEVALDVSSASATGGATLDVTVRVTYRPDN